VIAARQLGGDQSGGPGHAYCGDASGNDFAATCEKSRSARSRDQWLTIGSSAMSPAIFHAIGIILLAMRKRTRIC